MSTFSVWICNRFLQNIKNWGQMMQVNQKADSSCEQKYSKFEFKVRTWSVKNYRTQQSSNITFLCNLNAIDFSQDIQDTVKEILTPKISDDWAPESFTVLDTDSFYGPEILVTRGDFCFVAPLPGSLSYRRQQDVQTCH